MPWQAVKHELEVLAGSVPPGELSALADAVEMAPGALLRRSGALQLARGAASVLGGPEATRWNGLQAQEKQLALVAGEGMFSLQDGLHLSS